MVLTNKSHKVVCEAERVNRECPLGVAPAGSASRSRAGDIRDTDSESTVHPRTAEVDPS